MPWGAIIGGLASLAGGVMRNSASEAASKDQMDFQHFMSSSAHQREVQDLKLAGLNPMLSQKYGGAPMAAGSMPQVEDVMTPAVNTAIAGATAKANVELMNANTVKAQAEAEQSATAANLNRAKTHAVFEGEIPERVAQTQAHSASASELRNREMLQVAESVYIAAKTNGVSYDNALKQSEIYKNSSVTDRNRLEEFFRTFDWNKIRAESEGHGTWFGQNVMPFTGAVRDLGSSASGAMRGLMPWNRRR